MKSKKIPVIDLNENLIQSKLDKNLFNFIIEKELPSTNTKLKELAEKGAPEYTVLISDFQTNGKGRLGRSFFSPEGTGIYMSILLRPDKTPEASLLLTTCAAVCCAKAIEKHSGKKVEIKWVNDIYTDNRKVCGILTESSVDCVSGKLRYAIVGIGINVFSPSEGFPEDISTKAGYLFDAESGKENMRSDIIASTLNNFIEFYPKLDKKDFLQEYRNRSLLKNRKIEVLHQDFSEKATAVGIDDEFRLIVKYPDGRKASLSSGDVSLLI